MKHYPSLLCLALLHALVDAVAMFVEPLWPDLQQTMHLTRWELFALLSITQIAPNFSQLFFGYLRDRRHSQFLLWLGPLVAATALCLLGTAQTPWGLAALLAVGYVFVGSFHPEGAVTASRALPDQPTRGLSLFLVGGTAGLAIGPTLSGTIVQSYGLAALAWLAAPAIFVVLLLHFVLRRTTVDANRLPRPHPAAHPGVSQRRWKLAALLLTVSALRVVPNSGLTKAIAFTLAERGEGADLIGGVQSLFLACGSIGMLAVAAWFGHGWERRLMIFAPLVSAPLVAALALPECPTWLMAGLLVPAGVIVIGTTPAMVSYAHQLLPRDAGLASALTMGLSWGLGGMVVAGLTSWLVDSVGRPDLLFLSFVPSLLLSAAGACALPRFPAPSAPVPGTSPTAPSVESAPEEPERAVTGDSC